MQLATPAREVIEFRGAIFGAAALEHEYRAAGLFVYPSLAERGETFGLAPLEAMAHGCPVLVSDLTCFHDFVQNAGTGFIFDHRSADPVATLTGKLGELLADERERERVAAAGEAKSHEYTVARVADQFLRDFEAVVQDSYGQTRSR
jgi:glycosyltransferase involved in cell wall biosynthesis